MPSDLPGCSQSHQCARPTSPASPRRRLSRHSPPSHRAARPSSAVLSLLATIAASSAAANGSPAPPAFLCPSIEIQPSRVTTEIRHPRDESSSTSLPSPDTTLKVLGTARRIPDKFEQGDDGRWRRVDVYTLYGSTVCPKCLQNSNTATSVDDSIQALPSPSPQPSFNPSQSYDIRDSLPPGWKPSTRPPANRTTLILALSLVLALVICFLIIGCIIWRKRLWQKVRRDDVEMRSRKRTRAQATDDGSSLISEKEAKMKQKIWARATARWKANARYTARQRRGKRILSAPRIPTSTPSLHHLPDNGSPACPTPPRLPRENLTVPQRTEHPPAGTVDHIDTREPEECSPSSPQFLPDDPQLHLPPAYRRRLSAGLDYGHTPHVSHAEGNSTAIKHGCQADPTGSNPPDRPPVAQFHLAHVATDDKSFLARLTQLASAPPLQVGESHSGNQLEAGGSAPIWEDEELDDFYEDAPLQDANTAPHDSIAVPSLFPPPPSKGKLADHTFYDCSYSLEHVTFTLEPESQASVALEPSAPPFADVDLIPSAPPFVNGPDYAPSFGTSDTEYATLGADERQILACEDTSGRRDDATSLSSHNTPLVHGPVTSDGTLPNYGP